MLCAGAGGRVRWFNVAGSVAVVELVVIGGRFRRVSVRQVGCAGVAARLSTVCG